MAVLAVFDTTEQIDSRTTPDLLAQILYEFIPESNSWLSEPPEDNPTGENWNPAWSNLPEAIAVIDQFLRSDAARRMEIPDFTTDELLEELRLFREELSSANTKTSGFYLCAF
jgi:hypothetical protein